METPRKWHERSIIPNAIVAFILLILLLGIIEIIRFVDTWMTLQRVARDTVRYASRGQYNGEYYRLDDDPAGEATGIVPCVIGDERGILSAYSPNSGNDVEIYLEGIESLFATWYGGIDCNPMNPVHQEMRKDMLRILSIMDEADMVGEQLWQNDNALPTPSQEQQRWYAVWIRPLQNSDKPGWYNVTICSSRHVLDPNSSLLISTHPSRFVLTWEARTHVPSCLLNEIPSDGAIRDGTTNNAGVSWLDPGDAGDLVTIVITYNYPLFLPFRLFVPYVQLQAQRTAMNESFSGAPAVNALAGTDLTPTPESASGTDTARPRR
jgi:hypothetical protein